MCVCNVQTHETQLETRRHTEVLGDTLLIFSSTHYTLEEWEGPEREREISPFTATICLSPSLAFVSLFPSLSLSVNFIHSHFCLSLIMPLSPSVYFFPLSLCLTGLPLYLTHSLCLHFSLQASVHLPTFLLLSLSRSLIASILFPAFV